MTISAHALVRRDQPAVVQSMEPSGWHCCRCMPSWDIAVVYDAVMCGPEQESDRQGGVETACRAHDGIVALA